MQYRSQIVSSIVNQPSRVFIHVEHVFPFRLICVTPSGKLVRHCECAPFLRNTKTQAQQNCETSCVIHVISQQQEMIDATPCCRS